MATKTKDVAEVVEPVEVIEPSVEELVVTIGEGDDKLVFTQKPLSFFGKIEFFSVAGKAVEKLLSDGGSINDLLDVGDADNPALLTDNYTAEADVFIKAISKVVQYAPEILSDLYCIILAVPRGQREYVKMRLENELDDEQGFAILDTFVDQNWEVLVNFFKERIIPLSNKISSKLQG